MPSPQPSPIKLGGALIPSVTQSVSLVTPRPLRGRGKGEGVIVMNSVVKSSGGFVSDNCIYFDLPAESPDWELPSRKKIRVISLIVTKTAYNLAVAYLLYMGKSLTGSFPAQVLEPPILASICLL